jgi:hypothetical protein
LFVRDNGVELVDRQQCVKADRHEQDRPPDADDAGLEQAGCRAHLNVTIDVGQDRGRARAKRRSHREPPAHAHREHYDHAADPERREQYRPANHARGVDRLRGR